MQVMSTRPMWQFLVLLMGLSLIPMPALAVSPVTGCSSGMVRLLPYAHVLEDSTRNLDVEDVAALDSKLFSAAGMQKYSAVFTNSAIWLRLRVENTSQVACERWLTIGEPRLENIQVYVQHQGDWSVMRAGSDYALEHWAVAERQPRFRLSVEPGESIQVLVRVASRSLMLINPKLWDDTALLDRVSGVQLIDGLALGVIFLVLPIGLLVAVLVRSWLLLLNSLALLLYSGLVAVVNGYLVYWPALLPWSRELVTLLSAGAFVLFFTYAFVLLQVKRLDRWLQRTFVLYVSVGGLILLWGAFGDFVWGRNLFGYYRSGAYLLIPMTIAMALYRHIKLGGLAWAVGGMMLLQGALKFSWSISNEFWLYGEDHLGLSSALFIAFVLIFTLIGGVLAARKRESQALREVADLQAAVNERLESQVELRTQQLRELLQARSILLVRISHDLRAPLNSIINYARELKTGPVIEQPARIERLARQQLELLDDLMEFSRSDVKQVELSLQPGYLFGFLKEIEVEGRYLAARQHNQWLCSLAEHLPVLVQADFRQLRRVLINLLNNAAKFTRNGLIELKVETLSTQSGQCHLRFSVSDNGVGIPAGFADHLKKPFQRGSNAAGVEGFGLGLSIVSELLEQMGSQLCVVENRSGGSIFSFELRLEEASEDEMDQVFVESHLASFQAVERKVVLVDDAELTRIILGDLLEGYGFDVTLAKDAEEALHCLEAGPADLLITDQRMPGMNGWALLQKVRQRWPGLPVLLYSASPPKPSEEHAGLVFDGVLLKPATTEELLGSVEQLCQRSSNRQALG